ncbi:MAG: sodium:panthothenate symporter [Lentisphaeria bacterium]|nr:sodium:panthothenate symporter [Lentisphaeria bacterium]
MQWFDWVILTVPILTVLWVAWYCRKYIKDVTAFLSAGRVCGRYVIAVGDIAEGLSVIGLISYVEIHYRTGFATAFWSALTMPLAIAMGLFGYCTYRFRETKAQSLGQYIELRYSRKLRIFAAALRSICEVAANMIMPALAARFFIYFMDLPQHFELCGITVSTFHTIMLIVLVIAISIIYMGGALSVAITDTVQGFIVYPMLAFFTIFVLYKFSWSNEMLPVMLDRVKDESFINPMDISKLRDFNLFSVLILPIVTRFIQRMSWVYGGGPTSAAKSPHEQKMASLIGTWRGALGLIFYILMAISLITVLNHHNFAPQAHAIRANLTNKVADELIADPVMRQNISTNISALSNHKHIVGVDEKLSDKKNNDTIYLNAARQALTAENVDKGNAIYAKFRTLYYQLMLPMTMRDILPTGTLGLFCLLLVMLMVSTDDSRIFSSASTISQDVILPFIKKPLSPKGQINLIRWISIGVGVIFFLGSSFMAQLDYISLFVTLMCTMWLGGCGPMLVFGLYSRFGTTAGAWASLLSGMFMGLGGVIVQRNWANLFYPMLRDSGCLPQVSNALEVLSRPFNPWIEWKMNAVRCPINSYEWYFITMLVTMIIYIAVSYLTLKKPFNIERMLHRGKYSLGEGVSIKTAWTFRTVFQKIIGITPEYTTGDKVIAWSYFGYSFVYRFGLTFVAVASWNLISPWPAEYWGIYFLIVFLLVPGLSAVITGVWLSIGGYKDMRQLFKDLENRVVNHLDDGRVEGNMSLADKAELEAVDKKEQSK